MKHEVDSNMVSVIVPAYNSERYIKDCIDSILSSTHQNIEIIVVNDGSTDNTGDVIENYYSDESRVILINKANGGVCSARNAGLDLARGEYIMFVDSDDMIYSNTIEILLKYMGADSADIVIGDCIKSSCFSDGIESIDETTDINSDIWNDDVALQKALEDHPATYSVWAKLYKRKNIEGIRFVEGKRIHEDSFFVFETLLKKPKTVVLDTAVYKYRVNPGSASRAEFSDKFFDILFFAEEKEKLVVKYYPKFKDLIGNLKIKANMALLRNLCKTYDKKYKKSQKDAIKEVIANKKSFIAATESDKKFFRVIVYRMYWLYKAYFYFRMYIKKKK